MRPQWAGEHPAVGDFLALPARAIQTFGLYRLGQTSLASVHPEKQGVQLWGVFLYVRQSLFDFIPKSA
jgi:hypothetical protein